MKRVLTYGTFDLFHVGHLRLLERARALGDYLVVGVSTDEFNPRKGKEAVCSYKERAAILAALRCVDQVIPESSWEQKAMDIRAHSIDIFAMGDDWKGRFDDTLGGLCKIVYLERTPGVATSQRVAHIPRSGWRSQVRLQCVLSSAAGQSNGVSLELGIGGAKVLLDGPPPERLAPGSHVSVGFAGLPPISAVTLRLDGSTVAVRFAEMPDEIRTALTLVLVESLRGIS